MEVISKNQAEVIETFQNMSQKNMAKHNPQQRTHKNQLHECNKHNLERKLEMATECVQN